MSIETGGPAFPTENEGQSGPSTWRYEGMTMRDYFAAKAISEMTWVDKTGSAQECYEIADAMMKAREQ